jgi:predicted naringenin-chalcone synthase
MTIPTLLGLATGVPENRHPQMELHDRWLRPFINSQRARAIFSAAEIDARYSVLPTADFLAAEPGTEARNHYYMQAAQPLAAETINRALAQANLTPTDIDHFMVISCTGFDTPGLDVTLAAHLGMRPTCAAAPSLAWAARPASPASTGPCWSLARRPAAGAAALGGVWHPPFSARP